MNKNNHFRKSYPKQLAPIIKTKYNLFQREKTLSQKQNLKKTKSYQKLNKLFN
jgi:hypothetical protein